MREEDKQGAQKTRWDCVKGDLESSGLSTEHSQEWWFGKDEFKDYRD